jgi:hypothetical protein
LVHKFVFLLLIFLDKKVGKNSRPNDASAHRAFTLARRLVGPSAISFFCSIASSFCHPEPVEGFGHPPLTSFIGKVTNCTATVGSFIGAVAGCTAIVRLCIGTVRSFIDAVRHCTATVRLYINAVAGCTAIVRLCNGTVRSFIDAARHCTGTVRLYINAVAGCTAAVRSFIGAYDVTLPLRRYTAKSCIKFFLVIWLFMWGFALLYQTLTYDVTYF